MKRSKIGPTVFQALSRFLLSHYNLHVRKGKGKEYDNFNSIENIFFTKAEEGLPTSDFRLKTSYFKLQTSDLTKFELRISDF